jgi:hypothetical protein
LFGLKRLLHFFFVLLFPLFLCVPGMMAALVQRRDTGLRYKIRRVWVVARREMLYSANDVDTFFCRERDWLNWIASSAINVVAAIVVSDSYLQSLLTLDAAYQDALSLRLRSGNPRVLLLFVHLVAEVERLSTGWCWLKEKVGLVKTVVATRSSGHGSHVMINTGERRANAHRCRPVWIVQTLDERHRELYLVSKSVNAQ